jgi:NAD-dependent deacetylase
MKKHVVVLSGAGISAESGIATFRDADGLWEGFDVMTVASPQGWEKDPGLVLDFYNKRRKQLLSVSPNAAHQALAQLEKSHQVSIITQNVDDLHERAGSHNVLHLHGELLKAQSSECLDIVYPCFEDINLGDQCELGSQVRPFIVWFGEEVPMLDDAIRIILKADIVIIIGTSLQVYPAAGLASFVPEKVPIYYIDPSPSINDALACSSHLTVMEKTAVEGVNQLVAELVV